MIMPTLSNHCKHSKQLFGSDYKEYHIWKDSGKFKHRWTHRILPPHCLSSWYYAIMTNDPKVLFVSFVHDLDDLKETASLVNKLIDVRCNPKVFKHELINRIDRYADE